MSFIQSQHHINNTELRSYILDTKKYGNFAMWTLRENPYMYIILCYSIHNVYYVTTISINYVTLGRPGVIVNMFRNKRKKVGSLWVVIRSRSHTISE